MSDYVKKCGDCAHTARLATLSGIFDDMHILLCTKGKALLADGKKIDELRYHDQRGCMLWEINREAIHIQCCGTCKHGERNSYADILIWCNFHKTKTFDGKTIMGTYHRDTVACSHWEAK